MPNRPELLLGGLFLLALAWTAGAWWVLPHPLPAALVPFAVLSVALPALGLWVWQMRLTARKRAEVQQLAGTVEEHVLDTLTPFETEAAPPEAAPLLVALNRSILRLKDIYQNERDFSAHASHELRTPLSGIRLQAQLAMRATDDKARSKAMRQILRSVDRATHLVEQLLTLSRLAPSKIEGHIRPVNLVRVAQFVMADAAKRAAEKDIKLSLVEGSRGRALAHKDSVAVLLSNLLRNAIAYTPAGGAIAIEAKTQEEDGKMWALLLVSDNGPGIQVQDRGRVVERFVKAPTTDQSGTGLGLAIVKRIVDLHRGTLELRSPDHGTGLIVEVRLPAAPEPGANETDDAGDPLTLLDTELAR